MKRSAMILMLLMLAGCQSAKTSENQPASFEEATATPPTPIVTVTTQKAPQITSSVTPSPTASPFQICSPLQDLALSEIDGVVSNPFDAPEPGLDDGHHGVDLAFYSYGELKSILGLGIQSILGGQVAASIEGSTVYGNLVIIETPFEDLPESLLETISPVPQPTVNPANIRLTCPTPQAPPSWDDRHISLYLLYAHMDQPSTVSIGESISCGQRIGAVGTTGKSVNPHLHIEARWGPAGATFPSMSHYDTQATEEERSAYCTWRVSGTFQMIDPMSLIDADFLSITTQP